jgi:hypothetical protein
MSPISGPYSTSPHKKIKKLSVEGSMLVLVVKEWPVFISFYKYCKSIFKVNFLEYSHTEREREREHALLKSG